MLSESTEFLAQPNDNRKYCLDFMLTWRLEVGSWKLEVGKKRYASLDGYGCNVEKANVNVGDASSVTATGADIGPAASS
jgi:hypothetical protein